MRLRKRINLKQARKACQTSRKIAKNKSTRGQFKKSKKTLQHRFSKALNAEDVKQIVEKLEFQDDSNWFSKMDECAIEDHESTFFDSNYKETPKDVNSNLQAGYNLRSRRDNQKYSMQSAAEHTSNNNNIQHFGDLLELSNQTTCMNKMTHQKANN